MAGEPQSANRLFFQPWGAAMKLAQSWPEETPTAVLTGHLYDEYEEYDEVDESKDGCGGVQWWLCMHVQHLTI